jgi:MYXO-CTERM domain-containing protein
MRLGLVLVSLSGLAVVAASPPPAHACGGCFAPTDTVTAVDSHRMVIALSTERTTLWDQIRYTGNPADFVWVLPVPTAVTEIDVADQTFFEELDGQTALTIQGPPPPQPPASCPLPPSGGADNDSAGTSDAGVTIYEEKVVGPYQTVIIGSEDAQALQTWLVQHGYNVPASTLPTIQYYVGIGAKFVVLRLAPDQDVSAMQPIRVRYPGYMATFPLRMVTAGAVGTLDLTLWVIAEQRYESKGGYATVTITGDELTWDWNQGRSDYREVFDAKIDAAGGKAWVAQTSMPFDNLWFSEPDEPAVARTGLPYPYVTRLSTRMLVDHMDSDLQLGPSGALGDLPTVIQVTKQVNRPPDPPCPDFDGDGLPDAPATEYGRVFGCAVTPGRAAAVPGALAALALLVLLRRRRRA